jgi:tRNA modification GTPase
MSSKSDTIFALSSGIGKSAVALVRVSGGECEKILRDICNRSTWTDRKVIYTDIFDNSGTLIDKGIVLFFKSPRSFTGEDMLEFHVTGGRAVKGALLNALAGFSDTRPAEAGEFARRAFENGKLDLVQVEGLAAIVDAETVAQSRHSALMAFGTVSRQCEQARSELLTASALAEALLDFSDIEDPDGTSVASVFEALGRAKATLEALFRRGRVTERLREGFAVAIVGTPNAGKSTLINHILQREAAIVSEIPGTTRDYLEFFIELDGFPVVFVDTAGFRVAVDPIERLGIERSQDRIRAVDLIVWLSEDDHGALENLPSGVPLMKVRSKIDLSGARQISTGELSISALTGQGIEALVSEIASRAAVFFADAGSAGLGTERQRSVAGEAIDAIDRALAATDQPEEFMAEDIRIALRSVGRITGRVDVEDVLDEVFSRLCVGK